MENRETLARILAQLEQGNPQPTGVPTSPVSTIRNIIPRLDYSQSTPIETTSGMGVATPIQPTGTTFNAEVPIQNTEQDPFINLKKFIEEHVQKPILGYYGLNDASNPIIGQSTPLIGSVGSAITDTLHPTAEMENLKRIVSGLMQTLKFNPGKLANPAALLGSLAQGKTGRPLTEQERVLGEFGKQIPGFKNKPVEEKKGQLIRFNGRQYSINSKGQAVEIR